MKQQDFEARFADRWDAFEDWLALARRKSSPGAGPAVALDATHVPSRYREICQHLSLAQDRQYSAELTERLSRLALAGHQRLYGAHGRLLAPLVQFILAGFPAAVRAQWRFVAVAGLLFFGPLLLLTGALQRYPDFAYVVLDPQTVEQFQDMYGNHVKTLGRRRDADDEAVMFGFYIWNNVRIGFQTFAGGLAFGLGSIFYLFFNGVYIGTIMGYLVYAGLATNFFSFTSGHSAFELSAIALCGAAGMRLGWGLIAPGQRRRVDALRAGAREALPIVMGAAGMLVMAAGIEAFWSPQTSVALPVKYGVGIALWLLTGTYFLVMGRRGAA